MQTISSAQVIYTMYEEARSKRSIAWAAYLEAAKSADESNFQKVRAAYHAADGRAEGLWAAYYALAVA